MLDHNEIRPTQEAHCESLSRAEWEALIAMRTEESECPMRPCPLTKEDFKNLPVIMRDAGRAGPWDDPKFWTLPDEEKIFPVWEWVGKPYWDSRGPGPGEDVTFVWEGETITIAPDDCCYHDVDGMLAAARKALKKKQRIRQARIDAFRGRPVSDAELICNQYGRD